MINSIVCWGRSKIGKCHLFSLDTNDEHEMKEAKILKRHISLLQSNLNICIDKNSLEDVIEFNGDYIDKNYIKAYKEGQTYFKDSDNYLVDKLIDSPCGAMCKVGEVEIKKLMIDIKESIKKYNSDLSIIKKVQNYCKAVSHKDHSNDSVFFKFGRDKNKDLIAFYFNIKSFILNDRYTAVEPAFVFSGDGEYPFHKHTVLHLKREGEEPKVIIWGFQSNNSKRGHGAFMLRNLEDLIRRINENIKVMNMLNGNRTYVRGPIEVISADVIPGNIPYNKLVAFYNRNGLPTITRMSDGYGVTIEIYKHIN
ncbi:hypothetical protein [Serpentinicella alkaliphila]|uniref:Uncharacterized protein n=1 Tax=Serpentinicella alkaliphila TaxID=1734049 RepID=A0A4V2T3U5_9FIRM|nr:hypothetical protein [Serpentinicella alkaliphila]QUH25023.1 hypothetical protein HZR23_03950 [Serpentinicella alkaliphila]TCQ02494.1 hypothetical protein EDD79_101511 [Serpentinicella alkaliphila]